MQTYVAAQLARADLDFVVFAFCAFISALHVLACKLLSITCSPFK